MELNDIIIRVFAPDEWQMFKSKRLEALQAHPGLFLSSYEDALARPDNFWQEMVTAEHGQVFGLFDQDRLIGITGVFRSRYDETSQTAHFVMSYIDPHYRGRGLSKLMYEARLKWARDKGYKRAEIGHREGNDASRAANQKFGFKYLGKEEIDFPDGRAWDYRYELIL